MERDQLIRDVMQAAVELHRRKLWKGFTNFDCFAIRVPGKDDLLLASVMGDAGEQYGLMLFQGPHGAESFLALTARDGPGDDAAEAMDMLSFSMDVFGEMAPEAQAFYRRAGIHPRHDEQVPNFLVKSPHRHVRLPNDEELTLLLAVLRAVVIADRRKLLKPGKPDDAEGVCVISLAGSQEESTITVVREKLPELVAFSLRHSFAAFGLDLSGLGLLDGTWLISTPVMSAAIEGDDRSMQLLLVADDASSLVLQAKPFFSEQIQEAVDALVQVFRGHQPNRRRGIARTIVFSNRRLHDAMAPVLQNRGVKCIFMPTIPRLQEIAADFLRFLQQDAPALNESMGRAGDDEDKTPPPADLDGWKDTDHRLSERFADHLWHGNLMRSSRAIKRYFDDDDIEHYFQKHEQRGVAMAFSAWGVLDYRPSKTSRTHAEQLLAGGLPKAEATLLRARMDSYPTIHRVAGHDPRAGTVELEDVLLGGTVTVYDQLLSENIDNSVFLVSRTFPAGRFHFIEVAGPPLGPQMAMEAVEFLRGCGLAFTREGLKREAHKFGWLWKWIDRWEANWRPPRLCNTDGDDLLVHTASFAVADPAAARRALLQRPDIDHDEQEDEFVWSKASGKGAKMLGGPVTLGRIEFIGDELVLTINSAKRFEAARAWLTALPGVTFRNVTTERMEPGADRPLDYSISTPQPVEITPEIAEALQEMMDKQYMEWIDTSLPALGGKTPREACRTPAGRAQVTTMIRTMPDPMGPAPIHLPRQAMLRALGLAAEPLTSPASPPAQISLASAQLQPTAPLSSDKVGRNDPCPCGSGKKYKKCCGRG